MDPSDAALTLIAVYFPPPGYPPTTALGEDIRVRQQGMMWRLPSEAPPSKTFRNVDGADLERRLRGYYDAYYSELQERLSRYPARSDIFPEVLLGHRHIVAELAADGLVAVHWPADASAFEFHTAPHRMAQDLTGLHRLSAPSGRSAKFFLYEAGLDFGAYQMWRPRLIEGKAVVRPNWARMDIASLDSLDTVLDETEARNAAEKDVRVAADAYLMGLDPTPPGKEQQDRVIAELETAIEEFEQVVARDPHERVLQEYLTIKRNRILLDPSALSVTPHVYLRNDHEIDFVVQEAEGQYVLVEIERSGLRVLTKKGRPRAELTHAQQQVKDWFEWIGENREYARSKMPGIREPKGRVIMGRRSSIPPEHRHVLARESAESRRTTTQTYDDLIDRAKQHLDNLRRL